MRNVLAPFARFGSLRRSSIKNAVRQARRVRLGVENGVGATGAILPLGPRRSAWQYRRSRAAGASPHLAAAERGVGRVEAAGEGGQVARRDGGEQVVLQVEEHAVAHDVLKPAPLRARQVAARLAAAVDSP